MNGLRLALSDGREAPLRQGVTSIGRGADNDVVLNLTPVSRHHAEIQYDGQDCALVDLGTTNGTVLDGRTLAPHQPYALRPGSIVSMGGYQVFRLEGETARVLPLHEEYPAAVAPPRSGISPWVLALAGLAVVLLLMLAVLAALVLRGRQGEGATLAATTPAGGVAPAVVVPDKDAVQADTAGAVSPTEPLVATVAAPKVEAQSAPSSAGKPATGGQPQNQAPKLLDILPTVQGLLVSLEPLLPLGTPGASPGSTRYVAPKLVAPGNGAYMEGQGAVIILVWESMGFLADDEYYHVSLRYSQGGQVQFAGDWIRETEWRVPNWLFGLADQGRYEWDVTVRQLAAIRTGDAKEGPALSPKSETWVFTWVDKSDDEPEEDDEPEFEK